MYVAPTLTDLGSFQELTLGTDATGGLLGPVGSLVDGAVGAVGDLVKGAEHKLPFTGGVDDNSHVGTNGVDLKPHITVKPR